MVLACLRSLGPLNMEFGVCKSRKGQNGKKQEFLDMKKDMAHVLGLAPSLFMGLRVWACVYA